MWGMNVSALKVLVVNFDPLLISSFRMLISGIAVLMICYFLGIFRLPFKSEWGVIFFISIFNVVLHQGLGTIGLETTSAANYALILGMTPLLTMILAGVLLKQYLSNWRIFGFVIGFIGIAITTSVGDEGLTGLSFGDILAFLGALAQALSFVWISKLKPSFDPRLFTGYMMVAGGICLFLWSGIDSKNFTDVAGLGKLFDIKLAFVFIFSAVLATGFGHMTYNYAIKHVGPAESAIFINLNTLFGLLGASFFLGEVINLYDILGFILIIIGILFGTGAGEAILRSRSRG